MKNTKIKKIFFLFSVILIMCFIFPLDINAQNICGVDRSCDAVGSACGGTGSFGTHTNEFGKHYSGIVAECMKMSASDANGGGGYYTCINDEYVNGANGGFRKVDNGNSKKEQLAQFDLGIFNTWSLSGSGNGWQKDAGLGIQTCPGMNITYTRTQSIPGAVKDKKNLKIISIKLLLSDGDINKYWSGNEAEGIWNWSLQEGSASIELLDNGNYDDGHYSFKISINNLGSKSGIGGSGLGMNGRVSGHANYVRAYHYYIPMEIIWEYDNENYDPCEDANYAYDNPGKCCDDYPETCCDKPDYLKEKGYTDAYNFCCREGEYNYYGNSTKALPTFRKYFIYAGEIDRLCPSEVCTKAEDYDYDESTNTPSYCCEQGKNGMLNGNALNIYNSYKGNCNKEVTECNVSKCSNTQYFEDNTRCCCNDSRYSSSSKCKYIPDSVWSNSTSCKNTTSSNVATGSNRDNTITESIDFLEYTTLSDMKKNVLKAGTGFEYKVKVRHTITRSYKGTTSFDYTNYVDPDSSDIRDIKNEITDTIEGYTDANTSDDENKIKQFLTDNSSNTSTFMLNGTTSDLSSRYILNDMNNDGNIDNNDITVISNGVGRNSRVSYTYKEWRYGRHMDPYLDEETDYMNIPLSKTYVYEYEIILSQKQIAKLTGNVIESNTKTTEYMDGGNKFYSETTSYSGVYDFNISIEDSGITGNLSTPSSGFKCQYGVVNEITKNGKVDTSIPGEPTFNEEDDKGRGFYFRQISLSNPFPKGRNPGLNWDKYYDKNSGVAQYITHSGKRDSYGSEGDKKLDSVYTKEPMYEITIDSYLINQIKNYNRDNGYDYSWDGMVSKAYNALDSTSSFIEDDFKDYIKIRTGFDTSVKVGDF